MGCYIDGNQCAVRFIYVKDGGVDRHWKLEEKGKEKGGRWEERKIMLVLLYHEEQEWEEAYFIESINQVYIQQKRTELTEWLT